MGVYLLVLGPGTPKNEGGEAQNEGVFWPFLKEMSEKMKALTPPLHPGGGGRD